jgi:hypothetical protein
MFSKIKKLNLKKSVLMFSGGVDSSLLAYMLLKHKIDFVALHVEMLDKYQLPHINRVLSFLENHFNKKIEIVVSEPIYTINHPTFTNMIVNEFILENKLDGKFGGKTKNPPVGFYENENNRPEERDGLEEDIVKKKIDTHEFYYITPFGSLDKKDLFKTYKEENLLQNLYPLTFSCSAAYKEQHCRTCWWCKERLWGFEKIG